MFDNNQKHWGLLRFIRIPVFTVDHGRCQQIFDLARRELSTLPQCWFISKMKSSLFSAIFTLKFFNSMVFNIQIRNLTYFLTNE